MSRSESVLVAAMMLEQRAKIIAIADGQLQLAPVRPTDCPRCAAGQGCGGQLFGASTRERRASAAGPLTVPSNSGVPVSVGDVVVIGVQASMLQRAAWWLYAVPVLVMLIGALLLNQLALSEPAQVLLTTLLLVASFLFVRRYSQAMAGEPLLTVLRKDATESCQIGSDGP